MALVYRYETRFNFQRKFRERRKHIKAIKIVTFIIIIKRRPQNSFRVAMSLTLDLLQDYDLSTPTSSLVPLATQLAVCCKIETVTGQNDADSVLLSIDQDSELF